MSNPGRHSSNHASSGGRTPSSYQYVDPSYNTQQYLRPEDVYHLEREGTYYSSNSYSNSNSNSNSYSQSRQGSETHSPSYRNDSSYGQTSRHQAETHSPYVTYPYTELSRHVSDETTVVSSRRTTPPERASAGSRHSCSRSHHSGSEEREYDGHGSSQQRSPKSKGKAKEIDRHSEGSQRHNSSSTRDSGSQCQGASRRGSMIGPKERLVHGVFIRY